ncbi:MAG: TrkA family potassium uptake protein [Oscillospiraceae bacterium]|nr:TrkA family potassium uptake protein [Oscillospiraceae bacterium]
MMSFLVIGMGRFGSSLAAELHGMKHEVLAVDEREENVAGVMNHVTNVIIGDTKDEAVLRSLGVHNFDCVVVAMAGSIEDSILTTMLLKEMRAKKIVCKAQNERHSKILSLIGADKVILPEHDMGKRAARSLTQKNMLDYIEISPDYGIVELITPQHWVNKSIMKNNLRRKYGVTVIAIRSAETGEVGFSPNADRVLLQGDVLTVLGSKHELSAISALK